MCSATANPCLVACVTCCGVILLTSGSFADDETSRSLPGPFQWQASVPLLAAHPVDGWPWHAVKDPSIVEYNGKWHLFVTVRGADRSHAVVYTTFNDWDDANDAERHVLPMHDGYFCAPQVFWFEPHTKWYLICQASDEAWGERPYRPAFATTETISDPTSWSKLQPLLELDKDSPKTGLDFWVICDNESAQLFYTTLDGHMWRRQTPIGEFPFGWSEPQLAIKDDIFEASHTYKLKGADKYLTVIEAQNGHGFRYFKAYVADRLDGAWKPLAATQENAFASLKNVTQPGRGWTAAISHGELLRSGFDQRLEVDPANLRFLFQGVKAEDRQGKKYGDIPWQLGLLEPTD